MRPSWRTVAPSGSVAAVAACRIRSRWYTDVHAGALYHAQANRWLCCAAFVRHAFIRLFPFPSWTPAVCHGMTRAAQGNAAEAGFTLMLAAARNDRASGSTAQHGPTRAGLRRKGGWFTIWGWGYTSHLLGSQVGAALAVASSEASQVCALSSPAGRGGLTAGGRARWRLCWSRRPWPKRTHGIHTRRPTSGPGLGGGGGSVMLVARQDMQSTAPPDGPNMQRDSTACTARRTPARPRRRRC